MPQGAGEGIIDGRTDQVDGSGVDEWLAGLNDDEVQFSLVKMTMGDRESKRPKFVLVTWIGPSVGVMKKAKVSIHKSSVKEFVGVRRSLPARAFARRSHQPLAVRAANPLRDHGGRQGAARL